MALSIELDIEEWFDVRKVVKIRIENENKIYGIWMDKKIEIKEKI